MANDFESRLDRLEVAHGINTPQQLLVIWPSDDKTAKLAEYRRMHGLGDDDPVGMLEVRYVQWPHQSGPMKLLAHLRGGCSHCM